MEVLSNLLEERLCHSVLREEMSDAKGALLLHRQMKRGGLSDIRCAVVDCLSLALGDGVVDSDQDDGTDDSYDELSPEATSLSDANEAEYPTSDDTSDETEDRIPDDPLGASGHDPGSEQTGDETDDK